jgi:hypothetical protein
LGPSGGTGWTEAQQRRDTEKTTTFVEMRKEKEKEMEME